MDFERNCIEIVPLATARPPARLGDDSRRDAVWPLVVVRGSISGIRVNVLHRHRLGFVARQRRVARCDERACLRQRDRGRSIRSRLHGGPAGRAGARDAHPAHDDGRTRSHANITAYVGDFHIFQLWGLTDEPTLLIGMDVLSQARGDRHRLRARHRALPHARPRCASARARCEQLGLLCDRRARRRRACRARSRARRRSVSDASERRGRSRTARPCRRRRAR